jgi:hypothetical protein
MEGASVLVEQIAVDNKGQTAALKRMAIFLLTGKANLLMANFFSLIFASL